MLIMPVIMWEMPQPSMRYNSDMHSISLPVLHFNAS
jgi:hypothetical protein